MKVLIIGDSWGAGHNADNGLDDGWQGFPCINLAVDGSTAKQWASDHAGWLTNAKEQAKDADAIIISLLGNDAVSAQADGATTADEIDEGRRNLQSVVESFSGKRTVMMLYALPSNAPFMAKLGLFFLNGLIHDSCLHIASSFADTNKWLAGSGIGADMPPHPTAEGWKVIRAEMAKLIGLEESK